MGQSIGKVNGVPVPNLRHLRALCMTARMESVKRAAEALYISQPAVTQAIQNIEDEYGHAFFERSSSGMFLTEVGTVFVRRVTRALAELARGTAGTPKIGEDEVFGRSGPARFLTTSHLRVIIALAEDGSFDIAGASLGASKASVQRTTRNMEAAFGRKLFIRSSGGVSLTEFGGQLARSARLAVRELEHAQEEVEQFVGLKVGRLAVGSLPLSLVEVVPLAVMRLLDRFPDLDVRVVEGPYRNQLSLLLNGELDLMVGALRDPAPSGEVTQAPLFDDPLVVAVRAGHPLTRLDGISLSDTVGYSWVVPPEGAPTRDLFHEAFRLRALAEPKRLLEVSSHVSLRSVLTGSNRIALISRRQIRFEEETGLLTVLPIHLVEAHRVIGMTTRSDWEPSLAQRQLIDELERIAQDYEAEGASAATDAGLNRIRMGTFPAPG